MTINYMYLCYALLTGNLCICRYSESDTRVMLMTERERRQQEQAEPG